MTLFRLCLSVCSLPNVRAGRDERIGALHRDTAAAPGERFKCSPGDACRRRLSCRRRKCDALVREGSDFPANVDAASENPTCSGGIQIQQIGPLSFLAGERGIVPDMSTERSPTESRGRLLYVRRRRDKLAEALTPAAIADIAYTLYRGNASDEDARFHVATFDTEGGEENNRWLCEYAREMFQVQASDGQRFWCEKGHFHRVP